MMNARAGTNLYNLLSRCSQVGLPLQNTKSRCLSINSPSSIFLQFLSFFSVIDFSCGFSSFFFVFILLLHPCLDTVFVFFWLFPMALESPTASASLPTSVESSAPGWKYEVFLSFRSEDTRRGFTSHLYNELQNREIKTFMDINGTSLDRGEGISQSIVEAIQESRFAIVVLSQNYASSSWCLDELTQIMQCMENKETILPVFYHVDPSEVRSQRGVCGAALAAHEERFKDQKERLMKWRDALNKISSIFGWVCGSSEPEGQIVQQIAEFVCSKPIEIESTEDIETHGTYLACCPF